MWSRILLVVGVASTVACAAQPSAEEAQGTTGSAIIESMQDGSPTDMPEVVQVLVNNAAQDYCSGVLISPTRVLTAAHCTGATSFIVKAPFASPAQQANAKVLGVVFHSKNFLEEVEKEDAAILQLDKAITIAAYPKLQDVGELGDKKIQGVAVGRAEEARTAPLVKSKPMTIRSGTNDGYTTGLGSDYFSSGGDSGGPLFLYENGTIQHIVVGIERQPDPPNDWYTRMTPAVIALAQK
jgi:V8-like Glu-specific endopeptidase